MRVASTSSSHACRLTVSKRELRGQPSSMCPGITYRSKGLFGRPLFLQVRAEKSDESAAPGTRVKATQRYDLSSKHMLTLGVSPSCDITIADTTQTVGERHARVFNKFGCTWFQDLGNSAHGTHLILGHDKGGRDEYCLCTGDEFAVGHYTNFTVKVLEIHREFKTEFYRKKKIFDR